MPFINANLEDVQEQKAAPNGSYELQITGAVQAETGEKSKHPGAPMIKVSLGFTDPEVNAPVITHYITLPYEGDDNAAFKLLMLKRFMSAFGLSWSADGIDTEALAFDMIGRTAVLEVGQTEPNENGDIFNNVKIPRLRDEGIVKGKSAGRRRA
jgi:hypothetical protein